MLNVEVLERGKRLGYNLRCLVYPRSSGFDSYYPAGKAYAVTVCLEAYVQCGFETRPANRGPSSHFCCTVSVIWVLNDFSAVVAVNLHAELPVQDDGSDTSVSPGALPGVALITEC